MRKTNKVAVALVMILVLILIIGIAGVIHSYVIEDDTNGDDQDLNAADEILSRTFSIELLDNETHTYLFQLQGNIDLSGDDITYILDFDDGTLPMIIERMNFTYSYDEIDNNYPLLIEKSENGKEKMVFQTRLLFKFGEVNLNPIPVSTHERIVVDFDDQPILLSGIGSFDMDGEVIGYYWDYGDGRHSDTSVGMDGYAPSVLKAWFYEEPGTYSVRLYVMDNNFTRCEKPWMMEVVIL